VAQIFEEEEEEEGTEFLERAYICLINHGANPGDNGMCLIRFWSGENRWRL